MSQFVKNTDTIRVIQAIWLDDMKGNCRGHNSKKHVDFEAAKIPLQKDKEESLFEIYVGSFRGVVTLNYISNCYYVL